MSGSDPDDRALVAAVATGLAYELRKHGLSTPLSSILIFAEALATVGLKEEQSVYWAGRSVFVHGPEDVALYDMGFFSYWHAPAEASDADQPQVLVLAPTLSDALPVVEDQLAGTEPEVAGATFSASERLGRADLAALSDEEVNEALAMISAARRMRNLKRTRRLAPGRSARLDLRRNVAAAVKRDGEILAEHRLARRRRERRIVVLCDVSGSMASYSRAMLRLSHVLAQGSAPIEVFAVGTRLTRLTRRLQSHDANLALRDAAAAIPDFSGGTRLGDALAEFNTTYGVRGIARGATVVICSDGIDRGDPDRIASEMGRLSRVAHRILWVNPLAASPGYRPLARGMAAALPFVDRFMPGESVDALFAVLAEIGGQSSRRPRVVAFAAPAA